MIINLFRLGLSKIFGAVTAIRNMAFDLGLFRTYRSKLPVISVGNLTVGGNGKTPLTIKIAEIIQNTYGLRPVILSRGYGGKERGPRQVSNQDTFLTVGDEPLLINKYYGFNVVIARDRIQGAKLIEKQKLGDVIILDDGFQHRWLERDLNILILDITNEAALNESLRGKLLPAGLLREDFKKSLKRANLICLSHRKLTNPKELQESPLKKEIEKYLPENIAAFALYYESLLFQPNDFDRNLPACTATTIAKPDAFIDSLRVAGIKIIDSRKLKDHSKELPSIIEQLLREKKGSLIFITEKDRIKLKDHLDQRVITVKAKANLLGADKLLDSLQKNLSITKINYAQKCE
ncbi:MAG TPA: tetraacyldisaccharide 4'-kinase [Oligoflexia bacterium]|nr:tetraacyldisaccharide 4'-kinase [Oligoflexia bacterium]HMP27808.1 tetraacyldisaccharide 4'-kinase [Oligoflexia bacterium]